MKHSIKKNHVIITVLAVMIAAAGYLNYSGKLLEEEVANINSEEDTVLLNASEDTQDILPETQTGTYVDIMSMDGEEGAAVSSQDAWEDGMEETTVPGEAVLTSVAAGDALIAEAKLNREQIRAKNKETLLEVINNENVSEEQKQTAAASMTALTDAAEREAAAELLLEAKGYTDSVVSLTEDTADVVVNLAELDEAQRAQIEDIVKRKTEVTGENIIITPRAPQA